MSPIEKQLWRAFFCLATAALLPFAVMGACATALLALATRKLFSLVSAALARTEERR